MSSFSGKIKEFPQISVDRFDGRNLASTAYFLSHAHSDHMIGLSSPQFLDHLESNSGVYLYCSSITARFLQASIRHRPLDPFVRPLPHEEPVKITVPNVAEEASHQLCVTLIPAGHCPGSVMFLFEGRGGTVLYTGDFRTSVGDVERIRALHNSDGTVKTVDSLHIDTTFCHRDILHFPTREESATAIGDLVEEWLARGNNHLIHLVCPAKYGYEYVYRSLHERFGMRVHVSRWKYRMYDTVPEIQDALTPDATETWVHACDWTISEMEEGEGEQQAVRQLPCRCVPFGVDTAPSIRVIRPSAMFYTVYQSAKEVKQVVRDGSFCRVLLSMHASCSEVLDLVSYLRPRKVYPNVIPTNSTREEVLKLLHEALNRSGDHYSIEYGGGQQRRSLGSFKRQLQSNESSGSTTLEAAMYDGFLSSPSKRRRHSDSNVTLVLPTPRGNMKGSLSLEGEAQRCDSNTTATGTTNISTAAAASEPSPGPSLEWVDPYTPSPTSPSSSPCKYPNTPGQEDAPAGLRPACPARMNLAARMENEGGAGGRQVIMKVRGAGQGPGSGGSQMSVDGDGEEEGDSHSVISFVKTSQDSLELASVFSEDARESPGPSPPTLGGVERPASSAGVAGESDIKRSRKMWYKHKHFSTPVHDDVDKRLKAEPKPVLGPRSSSLPLPEPCPTSPDLSPGPALPLITVSSPSDPASESQVSDETSITAVLSGTSDLDMLVDEAPPDRPSVICGPAVAPRGEARPGTDGDCGSKLEDLLLHSRQAEERSSCLKTTRRRDNEVEVVPLDQQSL